MFGIQQGGIEETSPEVIRKSQMDNLLLLSNNDDDILENYELISKNTTSNEEYDKKLKKYPKLETEDLYLKRKLDKEQEENLGNIMEKPLMAISSLQNEETMANLKNQILENATEEQKAILSQMSLLDIIKNMPQEQTSQMIKTLSLN
ncbi:MAG TPA: ABC transporter, partial [Clostridiales bacterium]|nr:ABC transporter [Clostridiales bacterium]